METGTKNCEICRASFIIEPDDLTFYERLDLPTPDECLKCRWKYLIAFWISGKFRIAESALSGKRIITVLPESVPFPIYEREEFVSDDWDPMEYGRDYDPSRSFIDQVVELQSKVPHPHNLGVKNVNCDWCDDMWESRESYLTRSGFRLEFISYGYRVIECKNSIDITYCFNVEQSYDCLYCFKCFGLRHAFNSRDCINSAFLYDCRNCQNCFMSWNLRNKKYHIRNKPYSKEEYQKKIKELNLGSFSELEGLNNEFWEYIKTDAVHRANYNTQVLNSTGNFLTNDKNCHNCYFVEETENCRNDFRGFGSKDSIDVIGSWVEKCARDVMDMWGYENFCNLYTSYCRYSAYLDNCEESEYCFGCVGLRKKKHCILNKQYSKDEYDKLLLQIKTDMKNRGEWGKFFPLSAAYAGYNYSLAQMMFPMTKDEAITFGAKWEESEVAVHAGIRSSDLPDRIEDVEDEITKQRIICPETGLSYNIAPAELAFYREHNIPLPRRHFDWRTFNRFRPLTLMVEPQKGVCIYCNKEIEHYYSPELGFKKIACVSCYQSNIV
jgi:hypothetical protein